jgi:hypothetical protein
MNRFGLVYGFGGHPRAERVSASFAGLYGGVQIGQSVLASRNVGPHPDTDAPDFILDVPRASSGAAVGAYVGYGWTLGNVQTVNWRRHSETTTTNLSTVTKPLKLANFIAPAAAVDGFRPCRVRVWFSGDWSAALAGDTGRGPIAARSCLPRSADGRRPCGAARKRPP